MDDAVQQAMARWPNVPAVYGWLRLDRRGNWHLIDRAKPGFDEARDGGGSPITNAAIVDFIARNYQPDESGAWYWQNGPQRAYANLDLAPLVLRVFNEGDRQRLVDHCGMLVEDIGTVVQGASGELLIATGHGVGVLHDLDLGALDIEFDDQDRPTSLSLGGRALRIDSDPQRLAQMQASFVREPRPRQD